MLKFLTVCFRIVNFSIWIILMACHKRKDLDLPHPWQVQAIQLTQLPVYCNRVVVDVVRSVIRYLGSFSKKKSFTYTLYTNLYILASSNHYNIIYNYYYENIGK